MTTISILGTVGIPANYGGFETLAENLVRYHRDNHLSGALVVYCSSKTYPQRPAICLGAKLRYIGLNANGISSIFYDVISLLSATRRGSDVIILLGVSGAIALPLVRLVSRARVITNIDGVEWKREKWSGLARWFLRLSERFAVRFSHEVVADNAAIAEHVDCTYGTDCHVIAYGGDHATAVPVRPYDQDLPRRYVLALCRIEPENNIEMILEAFASRADQSLVFIGNWQNSEYGRELYQRFGDIGHLHLHNPVYDLGVLRCIRSGATAYVHGHSAGGTNPSLVEMMHFGVPVLAYDCTFNRHTSQDKALFFRNSVELSDLAGKIATAAARKSGEDMLRIARERYTWDKIGTEYFELAGICESASNRQLAIVESLEKGQAG